MKKLIATSLLGSATLLASCGQPSADQSTESEGKVFNSSRAGEIIEVNCEPSAVNSHGQLSKITGQLELQELGEGNFDRIGRQNYDVKGTLKIELTSLLGAEVLSEEIEVEGTYEKINNLNPFAEDFHYVDIAEKDLEGTDFKNIKIDFEKKDMGWVLLKNDPVFWTSNCKI